MCLPDTQIRSHPPHPLPAERRKIRPRKGVGDDNARQPYCHTISCLFLVPPRGKCCPFFSLCVFCVRSGVFCRFLSFLSSKGRFLEKFSGANFCFWVVVLVLCFLVGFCYCFCFISWNFAPETVWKNSLDVRSGAFWGSFSSSFRFFSSTSFFLFFFSRDIAQVVTGHPHTHLFCFFLFFLCCPAAFVLFRPFWPCVPLLGVFFGVPFWAPCVFGILLELTGLELARPF